MVSDDDLVCSYCKRPFSDDAPVLPIAPTPKPARGKELRIALIALLLIAIGVVIGLKIRAPVASASVTPTGNTPETASRSRGSQVLIPVVIPGESNPLVPPVSVNADAGPKTPTATVDTTSDPNSDTSAQDTSAPAVPAGAVHLADASLATRDDENGQQWAIGSVVIVNDGPYAITDFRLTLRVNGSGYALTAFNGAIDNPQPLLVRTIAAGQRLEVPVMTSNGYPSGLATLAKTVTVRATIDGPPGTVTDTIPVPN